MSERDQVRYAIALIENKDKLTRQDHETLRKLYDRLVTLPRQ